MARHFWSATSANTHQVPEEVRIKLLEVVSTKCGKGWAKDGKYRVLWHDQHAEVMDSYCAAFMNSPAGEAFTAACSKARKGSKGLPLFTAAFLREYEGQKGIDWGIEQLGEIFEALTAVTHCETLEHHVSFLCLLGTNKRLRPTHTVKAYGSRKISTLLPLDPMIVGFGASSVADLVMEQWIRVLNRFKFEIGSQVPDVSRGTLRQIIERIPTPPTSANFSPPFPTLDWSVKQWLIDQEDVKVTEEDVLAAPIKREHALLADGKGSISREGLTAAINDGEKYKQHLGAAILENKTSSGPSSGPQLVPAPDPNPFTPIMDHTITPAKMYAPEIDPADFAFIIGNTAAKVKIALAYANEELNGWLFWYHLCHNQIESWKQANTELQMLGRR
jgi:hypothetical protein